MERNALQSDHVLAQLKTTNGHALRNVLKRHQSIIKGTSSPSSQSSPNSTHNPNPMSNETHGMSSRLATPPHVPTFECFMTKFEMLQSQSKRMAIITNNLEVNVKD
jgi:hypothetical protein